MIKTDSHQHSSSTPPSAEVYIEHTDVVEVANSTIEHAQHVVKPLSSATQCLQIRSTQTGTASSVGPARFGATTGSIITKDWCLEAEKQIELIRTYKDNWNGYGSEAPSPVAINYAKDFLQVLPSVPLPAPHISASAEGGIGFSYFINEKTATIEFLNSYEIIAVVSDRIESPHAWEVEQKPAAYLETLAKIQRFLQVA